MFTIGVLLPGSTLYPSIGMDFLQGIKAGFKFHQQTAPDIKVELISFGLKDDEIYAAAERLLLVNNADVLVAYAGDHHAEKLAPLCAAAGKLLLMTNGGASYPFFKEKISHTIFHSFNDCLCAFLTGRYAARQEGGHGGILATSFFDGGYTHTHAMSNAFMLAGGQIMHNYVSHYKKEEFNTDTLTTFIQDNPDTRKLLAIYSGDMARLFYEKMMPVQQEYNLQWYVSPMMFDRTPGDFAEPRPAAPDMCGYTNWLPELENETNQQFIQYFKTEHGKEANLFSMQGWESALLVMQYLKIRQDAAGTEAAIDLLQAEKINSPRGELVLNEQRHIIGPVHFASSTGNLQVTITDSITELQQVWAEMCAQIPTDAVSAWRNTYLCI
ncbi:MAG: ABC transporter substrate-binding protein [Chitinophagaceae bacterium]|nr:ABC transporter substrate-binding protein [Chitinophagaceae bacterium]